MPDGFAVLDTNVAKVSELMTPVVLTATAQTPVAELARSMVEHHVHRIIVRAEGEGGGVAGVVSAIDLLKILAY